MRVLAASRSRASTSRATGPSGGETNQGRSPSEQLVIAPGPVGQAPLGAARLPRTIDVTRRAATSRATSRCGRTGTCRRARSPSIRRCSRSPTARRRRSSTSTPTRRSTATTGARHRRAVGHLLQARSPRRAGRRLAADRRARRAGRPVPRPRPTSTRVPRHVVRSAVARDDPLRGLPAAVQDGALGRHGRVHRRQLPGLRLPASPTATRSWTRTTGTR